MIGFLQKSKILAESMLNRMRGGEAPSVTRALPDVSAFLNGRRFGAPHTRLRPAVLGQPIGGPRGDDIQVMLEELLEDLKLGYGALIAMASRTIDQYDIFAVRRDRLTMRANQLRLNVATLLAQQSAGRRTSVVDSFNTLDFVDPDRTTAQIDLDEGICTLPPNASNSIRYDGTRVKVVKSLAPPGTVLGGPPFEVILSSYRLDAWYVGLPVGTTYEAHLNVTGADYEKGPSEEVPINAIRVDPTGPMHIEIEWSPEGLNWHKLSPAIAQTIRDKTTFHFNPVNLGFLRVFLRHSEEITASAVNETRPIGMKHLELMARGFTSVASLYSTEFNFTEPVHTVVAELDFDKPFGTQIISYIAQAEEGPWVRLEGSPVIFDTVVSNEERVDANSVAEEVPGNPATMWLFQIPEARQPLPESGELIAGRGQIHASAFKFDWKLTGDPSHIPELPDFETPAAVVRTGVFRSLGELGGLASDAFTDGKNPVASDSRTGGYMVIAIVQGDGDFALQPGYTYRFRTYVWCPTPITLERQGIGVVNPRTSGGSGGVAVAPLSLYVNGRKVYQKETCATQLSELSGSAFQTTVALKQGWNSLDLYTQLPADLDAGVAGLATANVYIYFQPNLFSTNLTEDLGIEYIQAYQEPWRRYSEFDLRYNVPLLKREAWSWKLDITDNIYTHVLLNHDPTNSVERTSPHATFQTLDGVLAGYQVDLILRYPSARTDITATSLFFRSEFVQDGSASSPPVLRSYRLITN